METFNQNRKCKVDNVYNICIIRNLCIMYCTETHRSLQLLVLNNRIIIIVSFYLYEVAT